MMKKKKAFRSVNSLTIGYVPRAALISHYLNRRVTEQLDLRIFRLFLLPLIDVLSLQGWGGIFLFHAFFFRLALQLRR